MILPRSPVSRVPGGALVPREASIDDRATRAVCVRFQLDEESRRTARLVGIGPALSLEISLW